MSKKTQKKSLIHLRLLIVFIVSVSIIAGTIGAVYAYSSHHANLVNNLKSHLVDVAIEEEFDDLSVIRGEEMTKVVRFSNEGSSAVFLRVAYSEHWWNRLGVAEWLQDTVPGYATLNWTSDWRNDWEYHKGWYYYKKVLPSGDVTEDVLASVTFSSSVPPQYTNYELSFIVEALQVSDEIAVNTLASQTVFRQTAELDNEIVVNGAVVSGDVIWTFS